MTITHIVPVTHRRALRIGIFIISLVFYSAASVAGLEVIVHATSAARTMTKVASHLDLQRAIDLQLNLNPPFHLGLLKSFFGRWLQVSSHANAVSESSSIQDLNSVVDSELNRAGQWAWLLAVGTIGFLGFYAIAVCATKPGQRRRAWASFLWHVLCMSTIFLLVGLFAPAMSLITSPAVPLLDKVVLQYQARSVSSSITSLYSSGYWIVGSLILLFSIITPLIKTSALFVIFATDSTARRERIANFLTFIGRWSMADVFVVAILLSCFAVEANKATVARTGYGLYFFSAYCISSLVISHLIPHYPLEEGAFMRRKRHWTPLIVMAAIAVTGVFLSLWYVTSSYHTTHLRIARILHLPAILNKSVVQLSSGELKEIPFSLVYDGVLTMAVQVKSGEDVDTAVITEGQLDAAKAAHEKGEHFPGFRDFEAVKTKAVDRSGYVITGKYYLVIETKRALAKRTDEIDVELSLAP